MDGAAGVLIILLSVILLIFLVLLSLLIVLLIRISRQIKHIADDAEKTVGGISGAIASAGQFTKSMVAVRIIKELLKRRKGGSNVKGK